VCESSGSGLVLGVAGVAAKLDQQYLAAYPQLKLQFAFLLWLGPTLAAAWWGVDAGASWTRGVAVALLALGVALGRRRGSAATA
jgi:hypothetical protein